MTVLFPSSIRTDNDGFYALSRLWANGRSALDGCAEVDLSCLQWLDANLSVALGVIISHLRNSCIEIKFRGLVNEPVKRLFRENGFVACEFGRFDESVPEIVTADFSEKLFFPYRKYHLGDYKLFVREYARGLVRSSRMPKMTDLVKENIIDSLGELFSNAKTHSGSSAGVFVCGQYLPDRKLIVFSIADAGMGFSERLRESKNRFFGDVAAIDWAMTSWNSARTGVNPGGGGLKLLRNFIELNSGSIQIVSRNGYWELRSGQVAMSNLPFEFPGTIVTISVNTDDRQSYSMKSEPIN